MGETSVWQTTAAKTAMASIGQHEEEGGISVSTLLSLIVERLCIKFLSAFALIQCQVVGRYQKKTSGKRAHQSPRTVPVLTMNPQEIKKTIKNGKEKIASIFFSRIAVLPFNRVSPKQDLGKSMRFQTEIKPLIESAIQSIGTILELSAAFATMQSDSIFKEVLALSNDLSDLDMRAQFNYSMLLFSTGKVC
ncbi:unnamed protein product [Porites evermanni]|uniref:Uncharacterized protein n=1 Tax=Porites evermanni TaxID=104178 RepID=A0ABN8SDU8_9CNID|nr:unnamed protein product [Porites evermanni]